MGSKTAIVVQTGARAVHAFHTIHTNGISAVPIVDKNGVLVATLSVSDLRQLTISNFGSLMNPVLEYIAKNVKKVSPVTITLKDTVETAILKLSATKVHRLWVIDDWGKPLSVISLTDIINFVDLRIYAKQEDALLEFETSQK